MLSSYPNTSLTGQNSDPRPLVRGRRRRGNRRRRFALVDTTPTTYVGRHRAERELRGCCPSLAGEGHTPGCDRRAAVAEPRIEIHVGADQVAVGREIERALAAYRRAGGDR